MAEVDLIDIHTHILPGFDDGSEDLKQSLAMAEAAVKDGVNLLVATPHVDWNTYAKHRTEIINHVQTLNQCLEYARVKVPVLPGAEYTLEPDLAKRFRAGQLMTINDTGRYLLVELPPKEVPEWTGQVFSQLLKQGVVPIIAHPETNRVLAKDPSILEELATRGVLAQVTAASLTGRKGRNLKKTAFTFLENGAAQLIASEGNYGQGRMPVLYTAFQEVEKRLGTSVARTIISHNPFQVIKGWPVKNLSQAPRESLWQRFCKITEI